MVFTVLSCRILPYITDDNTNTGNHQEHEV